MLNILATALTASMLCTAYYEPHSDRYGYSSCAGEIATLAIYRVAGEFSELGLAAVVDDTGWQYIDRFGATRVRPYIFDNGPDPFVEGLARHVSADGMGYFDERGAIIIPAQFEFALPFRNGRARVGSGCQFASDGEHRRVDCESWRTISRPGP